MKKKIQWKGKNVSLEMNRKLWSFILNWIKTLESQRMPSDAVEIRLSYNTMTGSWNEWFVLEAYYGYRTQAVAFR